MEELTEEYNNYLRKTIPRGYARDEKKCNVALTVLRAGITAVELGVPGQTIDYNLLCDSNNGTDRFIESYRGSLPESPAPDMIIHMAKLLFNQVNTSEKFRDLCRRQGETVRGTFYGVSPTSDASAARVSLNSLIYYIVALIIKTLPKCVPRNNFINFFTLIGLKEGNIVRYHNEPVTVGNITINNTGKRRFRVTRKNYILRNSRAAGRNTATHYLAGAENISEPTTDDLARNAAEAAEAAEAARRNAARRNAARRNAEAAEAVRRNAELVAEATRPNAELVAEATRRNAVAATVGIREPLPPLPPLLPLSQRPPRLTLRVTSPPPPSPSLLQRVLELPPLPPSPPSSRSPPALFGGKRRKTRKNKRRV
jgi:hypothetical protein